MSAFSRRARALILGYFRLSHCCTSGVADAELMKKNRQNPQRFESPSLHNRQ